MGGICCWSCANGGADTETMGCVGRSVLVEAVTRLNLLMRGRKEKEKKKGQESAHDDAFKAD